MKFDVNYRKAESRLRKTQGYKGYANWKLCKDHHGLVHECCNRFLGGLDMIEDTIY